MSTLSDDNSTVWWKRLIWFALLWGAGVFVLGIAAYALRLFMQALGLNS
ncbi:MAG TPA: DUF2474 domain-containing protein [Spongiibacteraceae bacterium]|jgi:hypothetical protein